MPNIFSTPDEFFAMKAARKEKYKKRKYLSLLLCAVLSKIETPEKLGLFYCAILEFLHNAEFYFL